MRKNGSKRKRSGVGIAGRWFYVTFLPTLLTVLVSCFSIRYLVQQNYLAQAEQAVDFRIRSTVSMLPSASLSRRDRYDGLVELVEDFSEKDQFEFMLLDANGSILVTSSGFAVKDPLTELNYQTALNDPSHSYTYVSDPADKSSEHIMAITRILVPDYGDASAIRISSSLIGIDKEIDEFTKMLIAIGSVIMLLITLTGLPFIRSITRPLKQIGTVAGKIAQGDFGTRIGNRYTGEIGDLVENIDDMADALEQSNRLKNDFISSISHEIRTPLTSIKGWGETLNAVGPENKELFSQGMEIIINETERLSLMVEDLLDFSRLEGNSELAFNFSDLDFFSEIGDAILTVEQRVKQLGIPLLYQIPDETIVVRADKNRLRQVMSNILDNAIKYSSQGKPIEIVFSEADGMGSVSITDHGPGIPEDEVEKVTERYYRASNSVYGTGIGLSLAKDIIEAHGGTLSVSSKLGSGTTVSFSIPIKTVKES